MILYLSSEATAGYALSTLADMQVSGLVRPVTYRRARAYRKRPQPHFRERPTTVVG